MGQPLIQVHPHYRLLTTQLREVVLVNPAATVIVPAFRVPPGRHLSVEVINDGTDQVDAWLESATALAGPFEAKEYLGLNAIAAGASRYIVYDCRGEWVMRVSATTTGAGASCRITGFRIEGPFHQ